MGTWRKTLQVTSYTGGGGRGKMAPLVLNAEVLDDAGH